MGGFSPDDALRILHAAGMVALRDDHGGEVVVEVTGARPRGLSGTAPRLAVAGGMVLMTRLVTPSGEPWALRFVIDRAGFATHETASVELRLDSAEPEMHRRGAPRLQTGGKTWLTAVNCQEVVDGDRVDGTIRDISVSGVGFTSARVLRLGDRLTFNGRFFSDSVQAEVRVASIRPSGVLEQAVYGCHFIEIDADNHDRIERLLTGQRAPSADLSSIHTLVEQQREAHRASPRKRRFFR
jgi:hypothetical protein